MVPTLSFARPPQSLCFLANLMHSSEHVTVHQDNSYLVSGELSYRQIVTQESPFCGWIPWPRVFCQTAAHQQEALHYLSLVPTSRMLFQAMIMPSTGKQLQGLVGHIPSLRLCLQGCAGIVLRLGWWTIHSSVLLFWQQAHRAASGALQLMVLQRKTAPIRGHSKLCLPSRGRVPVFLCLTHWPFGLPLA